MDKAEIRQRIWALLEAEGAARFPFPLQGRIPNFVGSEAAAGRLAGHESWCEARVVKANPDNPQRPARALALKEGKLLYMAVPRLRSRECFLELDPRRLKQPSRASTIKGASALGMPTLPGDMRPVDFILAGSVAVDHHGGRLGKGGGFSDLEFALLRDLGLVGANTSIATTVHPLQIVDEPIPMEAHDIPVDLIATPDAIMNVAKRRPRPRGIQWDLLTDDQLAAMPALAALRGAD